MKLITVREVIREVPVRWLRQYENSPYWRAKMTDKHGNLKPTKEAIYQGLMQLDLDTCTAADVALVIGNSTWVDTKCDECETQAEVLLVLTTPNALAGTAHYALCPKCLFKGFELMETKSP